MKCRLLRVPGLTVSAILVASCISAIPPTKLGEDVSVERKATDEDLAKIDQRPLAVGLILASDTSDPGTAPILSEEMLVRSGERLKRDISRAIPVVIREIMPADHIRPQPNGDWAQFAKLGRQQGCNYLAVVVSSTEQEYPVTLFLGWTTHAQPGFRRDHWSLLEFTLLDLKYNTSLVQSGGRGWATPDRPTASGINRGYPVVYLRPQDPERRIWPPTNEGRPNTLRVVSFAQADKRLALELQHSWLGQLEAEAVARRSRS